MDGSGKRSGPAAPPEVRDRIVELLPRLRRFCLALTGSPDLGDDLAQTTVERALARIGQWQEGTRLDSWMFKIAQNAHIDSARAGRRRGVAVGVEALDQVAGEDGRAVAEGRSELRRALDAIGSLPDDQRAVMALVVIDGQSYREAAEALGIPVGTVMSRLARGRAAVDQLVNAPSAPQEA